jgi:branched-chain amino acid aminotransferase
MYFNQETSICLNGEFVKAADSRGSLYSQTLHYGYGVFEGIRSYRTPNGVSVFKDREHYLRLKKSCEWMRIPFDYEVDELIRLTYELLHRNNLQDAYIRPLVYLGDNMGLSTPGQVNFMIAAWEWGAYLGDKMLNIGTSPYQRPNPRSTHIEAKACGHYINSILASREARERGYDEALLLDASGFVAEGPGANIFMCKDHVIYTPSPGNILPGITRSVVIGLAREIGLQVEEKQITLSELKQADQAFFCGTASEIAGIRQLDEIKFPMEWGGSPGMILQDLYAELVRQDHA